MNKEEKMKITKRIFFGILFVPAFMLTMLVIAPFCWIAFGSFDRPIDALFKFYIQL